jgi:hypothetical protein
MRDALMVTAVDPASEFLRDLAGSRLFLHARNDHTSSLGRVEEQEVLWCFDRASPSSWKPWQHPPTEIPGAMLFWMFVALAILSAFVYGAGFMGDRIFFSLWWLSVATRILVVTLGIPSPGIGLFIVKAAWIASALVCLACLSRMRTHRT